MALVPSESETTIEEKLTESLRFIDSFKRTHVAAGAELPPFYEGLLADASCSAWNAPAQNIKMLAMYLHHDENPLSAAYAKYLTMPEVLEVMKNHCVLWGWDVTSPHNWHLICEMVMDNFGSGTGEMLHDLEESMFPCIILLSRGKEGIELVQYLEPSSSKFNTLSSLYYAVDLFEGKIKPDLIQKEASKKQKSLFCGGGWTKVTEAMAINANMATYRFTCSSLKAESTQPQEGTNDSGLPGLEIDVDLNEILKVRQCHEKETLPKATPVGIEAEKSKKEKMESLFGLMREELTSRHSQRCGLGKRNMNDDTVTLT